MATEYVRVTLKKANKEVGRKRVSVKHEYLNQDLKPTSSERITTKEFYADYYSRKNTAWCVFENDLMISLYFEN